MSVVIPWPNDERLRHVKQLQTGSKTATTDCGPAALLMALQAVSGGLRPVRDLHADWIMVLREHMKHHQFWPATSLTNHKEAADSDDVRGAFLVYGRYRAQTTVMTVSHDVALDFLREGAALVVGIDYGRLNDILPHLSGSKSFRAGHFVAMHSLVRGRTRLGDALHDGRRSYPRGWQTVAAKRYLEVAETFGDAGNERAKVLVIRKAAER